MSSCLEGGPHESRFLLTHVYCFPQTTEMLRRLSDERKAAFDAFGDEWPDERYRVMDDRLLLDMLQDVIENPVERLD